MTIPPDEGHLPGLRNYIHDGGVETNLKIKTDLEGRGIGHEERRAIRDLPAKVVREPAVGKGHLPGCGETARTA
jgi:hypothetical protein